MANEINTGKILKLIETSNINNVPFNNGQFIIVDNGEMYYDSAIGTSIDDRVCLTPKHKVDKYIRTNNSTDNYYLSLNENPSLGDIVIIKDVILNSDAYSSTIYLYDDNATDFGINGWIKITESYNANNIYFDKDLIITLDIPGLELDNGKMTIPSTGKNLTYVLESIFSPDKNPFITQPSATISCPEAGSYEVGTIIAPTYNISFNPGEYEFGPDTNVTVNSYEVIRSNNTADIKTTDTGSFEELVVDENTNFYIKATIEHSEGTIPNTAKEENSYIGGQIQTNSIVCKSKSINGYLNGVYYGSSTESISTDTVTSDIIKSLNKTNKSLQTSDIKFSISAGTKSIIVAIPTELEYTLRILNDTANCDMTDAFGECKVVNVLDANNSTTYARNYNVWIFSPPDAYEKVTNLTLDIDIV